MDTYVAARLVWVYVALQSSTFILAGSVGQFCLGLALFVFSLFMIVTIARPTDPPSLEFDIGLTTQEPVTGTPEHVQWLPLASQP